MGFQSGRHRRHHPPTSQKNFRREGPLKNRLKPRHPAAYPSLNMQSQASSRIKNHPAIAISGPLVRRFWRKVSRGRLDECWPWEGLKSPTAGVVDLGFQDGVRTTTTSARFAYYLAMGRWPLQPLSNFVCGNSYCCNFSHWVEKPDRPPPPRVPRRLKRVLVPGKLRPLRRQLGSG